MKRKKFRKVVEWVDEKFDSAWKFYTISLIIFPFYIIFFTFFGWIYGFVSWYKKYKENLEDCREVFWVEIK